MEYRFRVNTNEMLAMCYKTKTKKTQDKGDWRPN